MIGLPLFLKLGLRNVFRNKRRSALGAFAVGIGLASLITADGFMRGMEQNLIKLTTTSLLGEGQVHNRAFVETMDSDFPIAEPLKTEALIKSDPHVVAYSKRVLSLGMVASTKSSKNILIYGINGEKEKQVNSVHRFISAGRFITHKKDLVLGQRLAKKLDVQLNDKVTITTSEAHTGELAQAVFRVSGFIHFGSKEIDEGLVFIHYKAAQDLLGIGHEFHEIVLKFDSLKAASDKNLTTWAALSSQHNIAESYRSLAPGMDFMTEMMGLSSLIMGSILGVLVALGIMNTLFMSIFERLFEFGVLRAIGTRGLDIFKMILWEAFFLGLLSVVAGFFMALIFAGYLGVYGVDYGGIEFNAVTFREPIYYLFQWSHVWLLPAVLIIFILITAIYPAIYAARLTLSDAMKKSL